MMLGTAVHAFSDPFWLQWHLTDACNLSCRHCYREPGVMRREAPVEALEAVVRRYAAFLAGRGLEGRIQLGGGEPLLATDPLFTVIRAARTHGIPCRVMSNGTVVTAELARSLVDLGVEVVQVSIDGGREAHDALRGDGTFERACAGAALLARAGIEVTIAATLCRENADQVEPVARAAASVGARRLAFSRIVPRGAGAGLRDELLSPAGWLAAQVSMLEHARRYGVALMARDPTFAVLLSRPHATRVPRRAGGCAAGFNGLVIDPDGTAFPCRRLPVPVGNVFEQGFDEIWASPVLETLRRRDALRGACGACRLRWLCGGCRAVAHATTGDMMAEDPQCPLRAGRLSRSWSSARHRWHRWRWAAAAP
jgi:radical SAM protein with 4Fe4S-binding SPASM domain